MNYSSSGPAWKQAKLGDLVSFKTGKLNSNAAKPNGRYPFFTCSQETLRTDTYSFDAECVLLAGNNANGVFPIKYYSGRFDAYQRTYVIQSLDTDTLDTRYLYYALQLKLELLRNLSTGATTKFLTLSILNNLDLQLPEIRTQRNIAAILSTYDDLIENNTRRITILEEMAQSIYREWFVNFRFPGHEQVEIVESEMGPIPAGWEVRKLGDVIELAYGKALKAEDRVDGRIPVYGSSGVVGYHHEGLVNGPGIVVGRKGNVGSVHWSHDDFFPIDTTFFVITTVCLHYVYYNLRGQNFINNDAAVPGLNRNQAYLLPFLLPDARVMKQFSSIVDIIFAQSRCLTIKNENLRRARDLLLPVLVAGEVDVEDLAITAEEEPGGGIVDAVE